MFYAEFYKVVQRRVWDSGIFNEKAYFIANLLFDVPVNWFWKYVIVLWSYYSVTRLCVTRYRVPIAT